MKKVVAKGDFGDKKVVQLMNIIIENFVRQKLLYLLDVLV